MPPQNPAHRQAVFQIIGQQAHQFTQIAPISGTVCCDLALLRQRFSDSAQDEAQNDLIPPFQTASNAAQGRGRQPNVVCHNQNTPCLSVLSPASRPSEILRIRYSKENPTDHACCPISTDSSIAGMTLRQILHRRIRHNQASPSGIHFTQPSFASQRILTSWHKRNTASFAKWPP